MVKKSLVIVGNGMATGRLLDELGKYGYGEYDITVLGDEVHGSYNRIMLSPLLANETTQTAIINKPARWYHEAGIRFVAGARVNAIDRQGKRVFTQNGKSYHYDELVLATGSRPAPIPVENQTLKCIYSFRTLDDVDCIVAATEGASETSEGDDKHMPVRALVIGGGLLGLEAAYGLSSKGLAVTLVHRGGWLLNRQLDQPAATLLKQLMEQKNVQFRLSCEVTCFDGDEFVRGAHLSSGEYLGCQLAVIATGITANKELGLAAGLAGQHGVAVDEYMRSSDPCISAVGECIEFNGRTFGLVEPIWQHCATLADRLVANKATPFVDTPVATKLKVSGVQLFSAGQHLTHKAHRELLFLDPASGIYRKILLQDDRIVGVVLFGDTRDSPEYFTMLQTCRPVGELAPLLLLGKAFYQCEDEQLVA